MTTVHQAEVGKLANELTAADPDYEAMHKDPTVWNANYRVTQARNALNLDKHSPERQQAVRDAEREYLAATNEYWRNLRMAKIAADKAAKAARYEQEQNAHAAQIEAEAKAAREPAFLASGGTHAQFLALWPRMWEEILIARSAAEERRMAASVQFRSEATPHATAPPVPAVEMVEADDPLSNYPGR